MDIKVIYDYVDANMVVAYPFQENDGNNNDRENRKSFILNSLVSFFKESP